MGEKKALVVANDLFFTSRIADTVKKAGLVPLVTTASGEIFKTLKENEVALLVIDLSLDSLDTIALVGRLKSAPATRDIPLIGFAEHTDVERLEGARDAGCEMVVSNRQFVESLKDLVEASLAS